MPIYGFQCQACGHRFDRLQKISDVDPTDCPACAANAVSRQLSAPQFRLSGGGWYETDFKKDGDKKRNLAGESSSDSSAGAKPESSGDSSAAKTEPTACTPSGCARPECAPSS